MAPSLPDELIAEIISPVLKVSEEAFADTRHHVSPFSSFAESTSNILAVCKSWLRVATPLLYNVVVVRSKGQAAALQRALKSNPALGGFIKKLRVEGGFGAPMRTILQSAPNITDIVLFVALWSADSSVGLCDALGSLNCTRLFIHDAHDVGPNKQNLQLARKIAECVRSWSNLKMVSLPYSVVLLHPSREQGDRSSIICEGIKSSKSVEEVRVLSPLNFEDALAIEAMTELAECPSIKRIVIAEFFPGYSELPTLVQTHDTLKDMVTFAESFPWMKRPARHNAQPSNPLFVPLASVPRSVQDKIWDRVLYFAMHTNDLDELHTTVGIYKQTTPSFHQGEDLDDDYSPFNPLDILLVSKQFKTVGMPHFYRHIVLSSPGGIRRLLVALKADPGLADRVVSLSLARDAMIPKQMGNEAVFVALNSVVSTLVNLVNFNGGDGPMHRYPPASPYTEEVPVIDWSSFETLARVSGGSLVYFFSVRVATCGLQSPLIFNSFSALRSLEWFCETEFGFDAAGHVLPATALGNLECLSLVKYHTSFLSILATTELPSLRRVYFLCTSTLKDTARIQFLARHHAKLTELRIHVHDSDFCNILDVCPDLPCLIYGDNDSDENTSRSWVPKNTILKPTSPHLKLEKIHIDLPAYDAKEETTINRILVSIQSDRLPALRQVKLWGLTWPTTERDIAKTTIIQRVEALLKMNISIIDSNDVQWRARLKRR
ncbi:hypothetical protein C8F01DRAFT_1176005 [Mycena amicta]|nr:hypothetical protein C8F01DRAFT_1176005 [Mycena amicta]